MTTQNKAILAFLQSVEPQQSFHSSDIELLRSAANLERIFILPNDHARGIHFVGGQGDGVSATGSDVTLLGALRSCLGEALERRGHRDMTVCRSMTIASDCVDESQFDLSVLEWLADQQGCNAEQYTEEMDWAIAQSLNGRQSLALPASFVFRVDTEEMSLRQSETNGCATGINRSSAICSALLELIERDSVALWWYGGRAAYQFKPASSESFSLRCITTLLRRNSVRPMWLNIIDNEFDVPVVVALSADCHGAQVIAGFGAHLNVLKAATAAIKELGQMELGLDLVLMKQQQHGASALNQIDLRQLERAERLNINDYPELVPEQSKSPAGESGFEDSALLHEELVCRLALQGFDPYVVDITLQDTSIPFVRTVVPNLESIDFARRSRRLRQCILETGVREEAVALKPALT